LLAEVLLVHSPMNMFTPTRAHYISNTHICICVENVTHVHWHFWLGMASSLLYWSTVV